jgi:Tat protein secretion system quality control protein TatD with DNase activity
MVKTDAPFMSPPGCHHFNSPINVHYIVDRIAKEFGKSHEEIAEICYQNTINFLIFQIN